MVIGKIRIKREGSRELELTGTSDIQMGYGLFRRVGVVARGGGHEFYILKITHYNPK